MRNTKRYNEHNQIARQSGTNVCRPWTRAEVEIARDRSLTVRQAAKKLGRTFNTVKHMRRPDNRRANELLTTDDHPAGDGRPHLEEIDAMPTKAEQEGTA